MFDATTNIPETNIMTVPTVLKKSTDGERAYDLLSRLLEDRIIMLTGEVNADMAQLAIAQLLYLSSIDSEKDITVYINSPGGSVIDGMAIYDTMQFVKPNVRTVVVGMAASMGAVLLSGGTKGKRMALPNAEIMIHQPSGGSKGMASDMEIAYKHMERTKQKLTRYLVENTGGNPNDPTDYERVAKDIDRDNWMDADEALKYGIIDKIVYSA